MASRFPQCSAENKIQKVSNTMGMRETCRESIGTSTTRDALRSMDILWVMVQLVLFKLHQWRISRYAPTPLGGKRSGSPPASPKEVVEN